MSSAKRKERLKSRGGKGGGSASKPQANGSKPQASGSKHQASGSKPQASGSKHQASGSKKGLNKMWDDDFCDFDEIEDDFCDFSGTEDDFCVFSKTKDAHSSVNKGNGQTKNTSTVKKPLQTLHMTSENQKRVKKLLCELQEQELASGSKTEMSGDCYESDDEQSWSDDDAFSKTDSRAASQAMVNHVLGTEVSSFAVHKLSRYGFDFEHCQAVLKSYNGNIGASLEHLLLQCFTEKFGKRKQLKEASVPANIKDCFEQRREEALVLRSICGDKFVERIQNRVWVIMLELAYLTDILSKTKQGNATTSNIVNTNSQGICKYYLQGDCKFGSRCKFKHETSHNEKSLLPIREDAHLKCSAPVYELEIRFPEDNKYPYQPPLVAFYSTNENLPLSCRLHLAEFLYEKALISAESNKPVVYDFVTCLSDEAQVLKLLNKTFHKYSVPPMPPKQRFLSNSNNPYQTSEASTEVEAEEDENDQGGLQTVHIEKASYVNLKKKLLLKSSTPSESITRENLNICKQFRITKSSRRYQSMLQERQKLPAWEKKKDILSLLSKYQVLLVSGMTGCGKTTQVPQFILDSTLDGPSNKVANIICTQPRRIAAISVAERVAKERTERIGITVGYQIRLERVMSSSTRLLYCTTGVLLRRLESDKNLQGITHIIIDEIHERTEESDFLLLIMKYLLLQRPELRVILMSATLNADIFSQYFSSCPVVNIPGSTFPVEQFFLEDAIAMTGYILEDGSPYMRRVKATANKAGRHTRTAAEEVEETLKGSGLVKITVQDSVPDQALTFQQLLIRYKGVSRSALKTMANMDLNRINLELIEALLEWIVSGKHLYPPGAVLVFLPGEAEIQALYNLLQANALFNNRHSKRCVVYRLHSTLSSEDQQFVFLQPPLGTTKIIISTNIAETSITINDVVYVIDSGKMKEKRYDPSKGMESLEETYVSKANALQRKGRAGRVASGVCFHLFSSHHYNHHLLKHHLPEIQRVPLEQLCLRIKILEIFSTRKLHSVFSQFIEPPTLESINSSKKRLQDIGALTSEEKLTPLGHHLASLPVDVRIGKLMILGTIFRCLDPALTIAASRAHKSPFISPWDKKEEAFKKKLEFSLGNSDYMALIQAYKGWQKSSKQSFLASFTFCKENFLSEYVLKEMVRLKRQFTELLSDIGFVREGLRARDIEHGFSQRGDGILEATGEEANANAENVKLISAILCAAMYPNVVQIKVPEKKHQVIKGAAKINPNSETLMFATKSLGYAHIHPSSVNYKIKKFDSPYLVYHEIVKTSRVFIRECSMVSVYALILFGGAQVNMHLQNGAYVVSLDDGWINFVAASRQVAELVKELHNELDQLLQEKIKNPSMDLCTCPRGSRIINLIVKLVTTQ
ncbi:putative ATP-dependent RNA helicase DHX57 [Erythrolamprus reginae]|uniref:putative ATP-dependent RNA helicase DHX57 n=1 Tax=Erythrolamprus reginae TaxID=121349 RepID=UPI00396CD2F7